VKFDDCGVKYGWAGNQAVLYVDPKVLANRSVYDEFLRKLSKLPVPGFLKTMKGNIATGTDDGINTVVEEAEVLEDADSKDEKHKTPAFINAAKKVLKSGADGIEKVGNQMAEKSEEIFRNKSLMKRQMLFYGVVHLYNDGLEGFMNQ